MVNCIFVDQFKNILMKITESGLDEKEKTLLLPYLQRNFSPDETSVLYYSGKKCQLPLSTHIPVERRQKHLGNSPPEIFVPIDSARCKDEI